MAYKNKADQLACQRRHYLRNKKERVALNNKRRMEIKIMLDEIKKAGCSSCPEKDICCLDFHHLDRKTKDKSLSHAKTAMWSNERLMKEINKCILLCANCHRKIENAPLA